MSGRPERKRSSLSGSSPIAPPPVAEPAAEPAAAPAAETPSLGTPGQGKGFARRAPEPAATETSTESTTSEPSKPKSKYPPKVSFYQPTEDTDRIRGAIMYTIPYEGSRTLSQFIAGATMKEVERLEALYNDGKPFRAVKARELPQGRPMGE